MIGLMALTLSVASTEMAAPKGMTSTMITKKMTAAVCTKDGVMFKMMKGKKMCVMAPMMKKQTLRAERLTLPGSVVQLL